jgi:hypothetical protein
MLANYDPTQLPAALEPTVRNDPATRNAVLATLDMRVDSTINLTNAEVAQIEEFFAALTDPASLDLSGQIPDSVPSGLPVN